VLAEGVANQKDTAPRAYGKGGLGAGLGKLAGKIFRIGHLGDFNDLMLAGTLAGVQMGLVTAGVPINNNGINAALERLQRP